MALPGSALAHRGLVRRLAAAAPASLALLAALALLAPATWAAQRQPSRLNPWIEWTPLHRLSPEASLLDVSCSDSGLCAAVDSAGFVHVSSSPLDPSSWTSTDLGGGGLQAVSCPSSSFCAAAGGESLFVSTEPLAGGWAQSDLPHALASLSCSSASFCAGADRGGEIFTSSEPAGGSGAWNATDLELPDWRLGPSVLYDVSCPSATMCVAGSDVGTVVASEDPVGPASAWKQTFVGGNPANFNNGAGPNITGLDCPSPAFCAAANWGSTVSLSLNPLGGTDAWRVFFLEDFFWPEALSCSNRFFCMIVGREGRVTVSLAAGGPTAPWTRAQQIDRAGEPTAVSCAVQPPTCVVVDEAGYAIAGRIKKSASRVEFGTSARKPLHRR